MLLLVDRRLRDGKKASVSLRQDKLRDRPVLSYAV
jgi:hypothetical protein